MNLYRGYFLSQRRWKQHLWQVNTAEEAEGPRQTDVSPPLHPCGGREEETPRPWLLDRDQTFQQLEGGFKPKQTNKQKAQRKQGSLDQSQVFNRGRGRLRQHETQETSAPRPGCCVQETQTATGRSVRRFGGCLGSQEPFATARAGRLSFPILEGEKKLSGDPWPAINTPGIE